MTYRERAWNELGRDLPYRRVCQSRATVVGHCSLEAYGEFCYYHGKTGGNLLEHDRRLVLVKR